MRLIIAAANFEWRGTLYSIVIYDKSGRKKSNDP